MQEDTSILFIKTDYTGIAGDMLLSSLAQLIGIEEMTNYLSSVLEKLSQVSSFDLEFIPKLSHGIAGLHLNSHISSSNPIDPEPQHLLNINELPHISHISSTQLSKSNPISPKIHNHSHYSINQMKSDLNMALTLGNIGNEGKHIGENILNAIIHAEMNVHQESKDSLHLHELGAVDTILDISGTIYGLQQLGLFHIQSPLKIFASPIAVGGGTVNTAHGIMPVPAPASVQLLKMHQLQYFHGPIEKELATPTGIAILGTLKKMGFLSQKIPSEPYYIQNIGIGVGTLEFKKHANILQLFLGKMSNV